MEGWRHYAEDGRRVRIGLLRERLIDLETKETTIKKTIENYRQDVKAAQAEINTLAMLPTVDERLEAAKAKLAGIHEAYHMASIELPIVQEELERVRAELEPLEKKQENFSSGKAYLSPSAEIAGRAEEMMKADPVLTYEEASTRVCEEDPYLAHCYAKGAK